MAKTWGELSQLPEFQSLSREEQERARGLFFDSKIAPQVDPEALSKARSMYDEKTLNRTWGEALSDTGKQIVEGGINIANAIPSLIAPGSDVVQSMDEWATDWREAQSPTMKAKSANAEAAVKKAGEEGFWAQTGEALSQYGTDPALASRLVATNIASLIPGLGSAKAAQVASLARSAKAAEAAGVALNSTEAAARAAKMAMIAGGTTNAALNAGGARGEAYKDIYQTLRATGDYDEAQAEQIALGQSALPAAVGGITGAISGSTGLERALLGPALRSGGLKAFAAGTGKELGTEMLEEGAPKVTTNLQAGEYDQRPWSQDLGDTLVQTAIGAGPTSLAAGAASAMRTPAGDPAVAPPAADPGTAPTEPPAPLAPDTGAPLDAERPAADFASLAPELRVQALQNVAAGKPWDAGLGISDAEVVTPLAETPGYSSEIAGANVPAPTPIPVVGPLSAAANAGQQASAAGISSTPAPTAEQQTAQQQAQVKQQQAQVKQETAAAKDQAALQSAQLKLQQQQQEAAAKQAQQQQDAALKQQQAALKLKQEQLKINQSEQKLGMGPTQFDEPALLGQANDLAALSQPTIDQPTPENADGLQAQTDAQVPSQVPGQAPNAATNAPAGEVALATTQAPAAATGQTSAPGVDPATGAPLATTQAPTAAPGQTSAPGVAPLSNTTAPAEEQAHVEAFNRVNAQNDAESGTKTPLPRVRAATEADFSPAVRASRGMVSALAARFGHRVVYVAPEDPKAKLTFDGSISPNDPTIIILAADSAMPASRVMVHEMFHGLKRVAPEIHDQLIKSLRRIYDPKQVVKHANQRGYTGKLTEANEEEWAGDFFSNAVHTPKVMARIALEMDREEAGAGLKFLRELKTFFQRIIDQLLGEGYTGADKAVKDLETAHAAVVKATTEYARARLTGKTAEALAEAPLSLKAQDLTPVKAPEKQALAAMAPEDYAGLTDRQLARVKPEDKKGLAPEQGAALNAAIRAANDRIKATREATAKKHMAWLNKRAAARKSALTPAELATAHKYASPTREHVAEYDPDVQRDERVTSHVARVPLTNAEKNLAAHAATRAARNHDPVSLKTLNARKTQHEVDIKALAELRVEKRGLPTVGSQQGAAAKQAARDTAAELTQRIKTLEAKLKGDKLKLKADQWTATALEDQVVQRIKEVRAQFPQSQGWAPIEVNKVTISDAPAGPKIELDWKPINYSFEKSPEFTSAQWSDQIADDLVQEVVDVIKRAHQGGENPTPEQQNARVILGHANWYRKMVARLRAEFGGFADIFADLLGATSPNTVVAQNWVAGLEALRTFVRGGFDNELQQLEEWLNAGKGVSEFKKEHPGAMIRKENDTLFGMNSGHAMRAMLGLWRAVQAGDAPKAKNFSMNLVGQSEKATIDVWAARLLQRLSGQKRIPFPAEQPVTGSHLAKPENVGGAFGFGQDVFRKAAKTLEGMGFKMTPADLQAVAWFVEKELWTQRNYTSKAGEGGSFEQQLDKMQPEDWQFGYTINRDQTPTDAAMVQEASRITKVFRSEPEIELFRISATQGLYGGDPERSYDMEVITNAPWNPGRAISYLAEGARQTQQYDIFISRKLGANEEHPNARPGIEIAFKNDLTRPQLDGIVATITAQGIDGLTATVSPVHARSLAPGQEAKLFSGLRLQYVPEISQRAVHLGWTSDAADLADVADLSSGDPARVARVLKDKAGKMDNAVVALESDPRVTHAARYDYDTLVIGTENYGDYVGQPERGDSAFGKGAPGQPIAARLQESARRIAGRPGGERSPSVALGQPGSTGRANAPLSLRPDAARDERAGAGPAAQGRPSYGTARPGSVKSTGVHYSRAQRQTLDSAKYGTGIQGEEAGRVANADDKRLRHRIYFYVSSGKRVNPEPGVGGYAHTVDLNNLYDLDADPAYLVPRDVSLLADVMNGFESAVIDAGFDGYVADFAGQRAAVLLGPQQVPVQFEGLAVRPQVPAGERATTNPIKRIGALLRMPWMKQTPKAFGDRLQALDPDLYRQFADQLTATDKTYWPGEMTRQLVPAQGPKFSLRSLPPTLVVDGVERPTTNSLGQPLHATEDGVRNFWRWFAPSPSSLLEGLPVSVVRRLKRNTKLLADFLESQSGLPKSDSFSKIPDSMLAHVAGAVNEDKVREVVIRSLPVEVVNFLSRKQRSPEVALQDAAMLKEMFAVNPASNVALDVNPSRIAELLVRVVANAGAELSGLAGRALESNAAVLADAKDPILGTHVSNSPSSDLGIIAGFEGSKVVDKDGNPLVVYHGTGADIAQFQVSDVGEFGGGIYLTPDTGGASDYARYRGKGPANVLPVYASIKNPATAAEASRVASWRGAENTRDELISRGYDGVIDERSGQIVAFYPTQIKSAVGNRGTFDPDNADIRYSNRPTPPAPPAETRFRKAQRVVQDKFNRFRVIQDWLKTQGVQLSEAGDVYRAEERFHARVANQIEDFREQTLKPLVAKSQKAGFKMADIAQFLHAQHAKERNDAIAKINPKFPDGGSGMATAEARTILAAASPELKQIAKAWRQIADDSLELKLQAGLITQEQADAFRAKYAYYVPLRGGPEEQLMVGTGKGLKVRHKEQRALGHPVREGGEWIIEQLLADRESSIMKAEKALIAKHVLQMAVEMQRPDIISVEQPKQRQVLKDKVSYVVTYKGSPIEAFQSLEAARVFRQMAGTQKGNHLIDFDIVRSSDPQVVLMASPRLGDNELMAYVAGHEIRIQINDDLLSRAYGNLGQDALGPILRAGRVLNTWLSKVYTGYNPEFILVNLMRDFTTGIANLSGEQGAMMAMRAVKRYPKAFRDLLRYARNPARATQSIKDYREDGGNTGAAYLDDLERIGTDVAAEYAKLQGVIGNLRERNARGAASSAIGNTIKPLVSWIEKLNQAGENAMRLAIYQAMRDSGKGRVAAASAAKNTTVNFNRKGELGLALNAWWLFFNAAVQGTSSIAHAHFKGATKGQAWAFSAGLAGTAYLAALLAAGDDEEDDEYEKISEYDRSRNLIIRTENGFVKLPLPYGYGFFANLGRGLADAQRTGELGKLPWHLASGFIEEFTPFGALVAGKQPDWQQAVTFMGPTAWQIGAVPAYNRTSFGTPLYPEQSFKTEEFARDQMWRGTKGTWADELAGALEAVGMDVSPETLKHLWRTGTGGAGTFVTGVADAVQLKARGAEDLDAREIPLLRKFRSVPGVQEARARYYEAVEEAKVAKETFARFKKQGRFEEMETYQGENEALISMAKVAEATAKRIKKARDLYDSVKLDETLPLPEKRRQLRAMEVEETRIYDDYVRMFQERTRVAPR